MMGHGNFAKLQFTPLHVATPNDPANEQPRPRKKTASPAGSGRRMQCEAMIYTAPNKKSRSSRLISNIYGAYIPKFDVLSFGNVATVELRAAWPR